MYTVNKRIVNTVSHEEAYFNTGVVKRDQFELEYGRT